MNGDFKQGVLKLSEDQYAQFNEMFKEIGEERNLRKLKTKEKINGQEKCI